MLLLAAVLTVFYLPTANYGLAGQSSDTLANALTGWAIANDQTFYLDTWASVTELPYYEGGFQFVLVEDRPVSKFPPGAAVLTAPLYLIWSDAPQVTSYYRAPTGTLPVTFRLPSFVPAAIVASGTSALAVASLSAIVRRQSHHRALLFALVMGLGTSYWSVAADALWQHGPVAMWLSMGALALFRRHPWRAGVLFGLAVLTRPQVAVAIAFVGLWVAWRWRSWRALLAVGVGSSAGAACYAAFNTAVFGNLLPEQAGGYWVSGALQPPSSSLLGDLVRTFVDPSRGLLIWSPIVAVSVAGLVAGWRRADDVTRGLALAGAALLLVQLRGNVWYGGSGFFAYRYPLEPLLLAAPLLAGSLFEWVGSNPFRIRIATVAASSSVLIHAFGAATQWTIN